jgi:aconitate hydratase
VAHPNSFGARSTLSVGGREYEIWRLDALQAKWDVARLPYSLKVLLENLLRSGSDDDAVRAVAGWVAADEPAKEIAFRPGRVLMQDFTGVPAMVDLAAMRDAIAELVPPDGAGSAAPPDPARSTRSCRWIS